MKLQTDLLNLATDVCTVDYEHWKLQHSPLYMTKQQDEQTYTTTIPPIFHL